MFIVKLYLLCDRATLATKKCVQGQRDHYAITAGQMIHLKQKRLDHFVYYNHKGDFVTSHHSYYIQRDQNI